MNGHIVIDPKICSGKPVLRGTRSMVKNILGMIAGGYNIDKILDAYSELTNKRNDSICSRICSHHEIIRLRV